LRKDRSYLSDIRGVVGKALQTVMKRLLSLRGEEFPAKLVNICWWRTVMVWDFLWSCLLQHQQLLIFFPL